LDWFQYTVKLEQGHYLLYVALTRCFALALSWYARLFSFPPFLTFYNFLDQSGKLAILVGGFLQKQVLPLSRV